MAKSPSINLVEQDLSAYTPQDFEGTVLAVVGFATKGPFGVATLVNSRTDFLSEFGTPPEDYPYSSLAVYRAFNQGNQILFKRIGDTTGDSLAATVSARVVNVGSGGDSKYVRFETQEKGTATANVTVVVSTESNPITSGHDFELKVYHNGHLKESFKPLSINNGDTNFFETVINKDDDNGGSAWITISTYAVSGDSNFNIGDTSADMDDVTYYVGADDGDTTEVEFTFGDTWTAGAYTYATGQDGIPSGDTDRANLFVTALGTGTDLANMEINNFHILVTPDSGSELTQNAAITLAEYRKDFIYIADPPYALDYDEVVEWHNGTGSHGRTAAMNSSYACTYWPWLKDYNSHASEYVWCPPSVFMAEKFMQVDRLYGPWYAAAGDLRGRIIAYDYEASPSLLQRDAMYGGLNAVNPIVNFASKGITVFGQKTLYRAYTALNRLTVRRMVVYVKKLVKNALEGLVFEPNNADSWNRATNIINSILEPIRQKNGLEDYRVIIDSSTTTPDLIANNIMSGVIKLLPVGTIEVIDLSVQIFSPGASIT